MAEPNDANENHQLIIDIISENIRETAYKKQETTLIFQINDDIEVASQEEGYIGSYYQASIVHPIGAYHYKVKYKTLVNDDKTAPLEESVHVSEVHLLFHMKEGQWKSTMCMPMRDGGLG